VYHSYVVPCFLDGTEAGNWTAAHVNTLEAAHTACLRHIMGVSRVERRTLQHIRTTCGSKSLERMLIQRTVAGPCDAHARQFVQCHGFQLQAGGWCEGPWRAQGDVYTRTGI
jgi:hypothetical protein